MASSTDPAVSTAVRVLAERVQLPTLPAAVARINELIADPKAGPQEIGREIGSDPALAARVLRLANSSIYGLQDEVSSTEQAATVIGVRSLRNIAMQASIIRKYEHLAEYDAFDLEEVWTHSGKTARLAQMLAQASERRGKPAPEELFTCGLLHDIGKVVLLDTLGEEYLGVLANAREAGCSLHLAEQQVLGFTHVEVGARLAAHWQLSRAIQRAIGAHHGRPEVVLADPVVATVAIADQVAYRSRQDGDQGMLATLGEVAERVLRVPADAFERVLEASHEVVPT